MAIKVFTAILLILSLNSIIKAQSDICPEDPPQNLWLADSPYPIYHRNSYAQASSCIESIRPEDSISIRLRRDITGGTSPWIYLTDKYPNGERCILYSNSTHVFKFIDNGVDIVAIDSIRIDFDSFTSFGYNHLLSKNGIWFSYDPDYNPEDDIYTRLFKFQDRDPDDPYSDIIALDTFNFSSLDVPAVNMYNLNYNGEIVWYSERDTLDEFAYAGVISQDFEVLDTIRFNVLPNERVNHNSISVDEENNFYIVTSHRLIQFSWDGTTVDIAWQAEYDFVNDGPVGNFAYGSGTTPTLMGWKESEDKLIIVADGHANNNLVAFWRELPDNWVAKPGMPLHFADSISIPNARSFSNLFQSIENSPTVYDYEIAIAQFNGFLGYDCENLKGVSKFQWDTDTNELVLGWTNNQINMNGVLAYSSGSNLVYGSGKEEDCNYHFYGLDWDTGETKIDFIMGAEGTFLDDPFYDAGVNNIIDDEGNIFFSGGGSLVKLEKQSLSSNENAVYDSKIRIFPNPANEELFWECDFLKGERYSIVNIDGHILQTGILENPSLNISQLPSGILFLKVSTPEGNFTERFIKL